MANVIVALALLVGSSIALTIEYLLLDRIFHHPAAGQAVDVPVEYVLLAAAPLVTMLVTYWLKRSPTTTGRDLKFLIGCWVVGIAGGVIALAQYSHSTPGFLLLAYVGQWLIVLRYLLVRKIGQTMTISGR